MEDLTLYRRYDHLDDAPEGSIHVLDVPDSYEDPFLTMVPIVFLQIGWFDPGSKRFCYTDVKEHSPNHHASYTEPVLVAIDVT